MWFCPIAVPNTFVPWKIYNSVTNATKHTNGDWVEIQLQTTDRGLELRIADNGTVMEKGYKTTGLGTSNMHMRAEKIGGKLENRDFL